ncbi:MAG: ATP-binding protein [Proteobacteria bacterium]|nr:ATP-binding protein [Pseudomonadota bacterium]
MSDVTPHKPPSPQAMHALLTLEAMRLGVVPATDLAHSTVGRDIEIDIIQQDLSHTRLGGARRAFLGEYGLGKTHLLELIQQIALRQNFVVSKVVLDHTEFSPSQPKRIYHAVMRNLLYPDNPQQLEGLAPILDRAANDETILEKYLVKTTKGKHPTTIREQLAAGMHLYLTPALAYTRAINNPKRLILPSHLGDPISWAANARHILIDWIEGHPTRSNQDINDELNLIRGKFPKIYSLLDYRPWAKIYGYILNGIAQLARDVGYAGLVIVIDEAEFYTLLSPQNRTYARSLFQAWSHAVGGSDDGSLPFSQDNLLTGGYGIQRELPTRYTDNPGLYLVFAMTPNSEGIRVLQEAIAPQFICYLNPLTAVDYLKMTQNIVELYAKAYPQCPLPDGIAHPLANIVDALSQQGQLATPRQTMKFLTDFLDLVRYVPEQIPDVIANLMAQSDF